MKSPIVRLSRDLHERGPALSKLWRILGPMSSMIEKDSGFSRMEGNHGELLLEG